MRLLIICLFLFCAGPALSFNEIAITRQVEKEKPVKSEKDLKMLVKNVTRSLKTDKEKAYALLVWIAQNIDYDDYNPETDKLIFKNYTLQTLKDKKINLK